MSPCCHLAFKVGREVPWKTQLFYHIREQGGKSCNEHTGRAHLSFRLSRAARSTPPCPLGHPPSRRGKKGKMTTWGWHIGPLREGAVGKADWGSTAWTTNSRKQRCAPPRTPKPSLAGGVSVPKRASPDGANYNKLVNYSDEWATLVEMCFHPKCEELGYCPEKKSCGRMSNERT